MDTASSQVEVFSICLFSPQTDGEHKQIKTLDLWRCDIVDPCVDYQFHLHDYIPTDITIKMKRRDYIHQTILQYTGLVE
jgi:hypothetical protein